MASIGGATDTSTTPDLAQLKKMLDDHRTATADARSHSVVDIDYYDTKQWTPAERRALKKRKQADLTDNCIKPAINGILGVTQRGKSVPTAYPRTPQDEPSADVATDALRFMAERARFSALKLDVFKDILVPGSGAVLVGVDEDRNIAPEQIRWEEFVYDPRSRRPDFKDARYLGIAKWMFVDDAKLLWPEKAADLESANEAGGVGVMDESFRDRPVSVAWVDRRARRLMIVEMYYREQGKWFRACYHNGGILDFGPSPYTDERKRPVCPIEAQSAYVDRDNNRYGLVRDMRGLQDEVNQRHSKGLHWLNVRQIQETSPGASVVNAEEARLEAARPDGVIPSGWQVVPGATQAVHDNMEMLQWAIARLERMGPNPAVLGRDGQDSSGRALLARQQAGLVELAVQFGGLEDWELRVYRQMWARGKQYWTAPMWIRVTKNEESPQFVGLNQPRGEPVVHPAADETGQPHPMAGQPVIDPQTQQPLEQAPQLHPQLTSDPFTNMPVPHPQAGHPVLGYKNQVAEMDVDITIDTTPDTATLQQEQYQDLLQLIGTSPLYQQQVPLASLVKLSNMPHKKDVLDDLQQGQQAGQAQQQQAQQFAQQAHEAGLAKTASEIELNKARAAHAQITGEVSGAKGLLEAHEAGQDSATHEPHQHNQSSQPEPETVGA